MRTPGTQKVPGKLTVPLRWVIEPELTYRGHCQGLSLARDSYRFREDCVPDLQGKMWGEVFPGLKLLFHPGVSGGASTCPKNKQWLPPADRAAEDSFAHLSNQRPRGEELERGANPPKAGWQNGCDFPALGICPIPLDMNSQIHRKEEKHGISYTLGARWQGGHGRPQGTVLHMARFLNCEDFDLSLGNE